MANSSLPTCSTPTSLGSPVARSVNPSASFSISDTGSVTLYVTLLRPRTCLGRASPCDFGGDIQIRLSAQRFLLPSGTPSRPRLRARCRQRRVGPPPAGGCQRRRTPRTGNQAGTASGPEASRSWLLALGSWLLALMILCTDSPFHCQALNPAIPHFRQPSWRRPAR